MRELSSDAAHSSVSHQRARRVAGRFLTGLSAAGVTAALALTTVVSDASASPNASASARVVTLTSNSTAPTGHLTVQLKYRLEPRGRNKLLSVTYSGASKISLKHPALIVSLRPVPAMRLHGSVRAVAFSVILRLHTSKHFSGALPAKLLALISKSLAGPPRHIHPAGSVLSATVASVSQPNGQIGVAVPVGLQVGVLIGPVLR